MNNLIPLLSCLFFPLAYAQDPFKISSILGRVTDLVRVAIKNNSEPENLGTT